MNSTAILYPAFAMFFLTLGCFLALGICRYRAIHNRQVRISYFRTYDEGSQPKYLQVMARHLQNHFEVPPIFYAGVILNFITLNNSLVALVFAWLFVATRVVHSIIHLGKNNVSHRFFTFGFSLFCLCGVWASALFHIMQTGN